MYNIMRCPLCGEERYIRSKTYDVDMVINKYRQCLNVDVRNYFAESNINLHRCLNCGMGYFPNSVEGDSGFYEQLSLFPWYYMEEKPEFDLALEFIRRIKPKSILEIGSGRGAFLDHVKDSFDVYATEQNLEAVEILRAKGIPLDKDGNKYDFIVTFQVLEHVKMLGTFFKWMTNKLNSNGYLFISVPNPDSPFFKEQLDILNMPPHHMNHIYKETMDKIAAMYNFSIIEYNALPIELVHLNGIVNNRMNIDYGGVNVNSKNFVKGIVKKICDKIFVRPYITAINAVFKDMLDIQGHTHAILLKKN